ncbi:hypothetical protein M8818_001522 [Zalaria obscura]|uniref:Uncharacterized protein n=1 Tax=Zalaria obscura TaxID=2024903 RepID=A0ACC3SKI3_9PEZI
MAARRASVAAARVLVNYGRLTGPRVARPLWQSQTPIRSAPVQKVTVPVRWHSSSGSKSTVYDFESIKDLSSKPSEDRILIDVREPAEYEGGFIPNAINVPVASQPDAWFLPEDEFEDRFGFEKPSKDKEVIFYCKAGVRSSAAAQLAQQQGYEKIGEYRGSWLDWQKNGGQAAK